jgi:hypothetical protein
MRITADQVIYTTGDNKDRVNELSEMLDKRYVELTQRAALIDKTHTFKYGK